MLFSTWAKNVSSLPLSHGKRFWSLICTQCWKKWDQNDSRITHVYLKISKLKKFSVVNIRDGWDTFLLPFPYQCLHSGNTYLYLPRIISYTPSQDHDISKHVEAKLHFKPLSTRTRAWIHAVSVTSHLLRLSTTYFSRDLWNIWHRPLLWLQQYKGPKPRSLCSTSTVSH